MCYVYDHLHKFILTLNLNHETIDWMCSSIPLWSKSNRIYINVCMILHNPMQSKVCAVLRAVIDNKYTVEKERSTYRHTASWLKIIKNKNQFTLWQNLFGCVFFCLFPILHLYHMHTSIRFGLYQARIVHVFPRGSVQLFTYGIVFEYISPLNDFVLTWLWYWFQKCIHSFSYLQIMMTASDLIANRLIWSISDPKLVSSNEKSLKCIC